MRVLFVLAALVSCGVSAAEISDVAARDRAIRMEKIVTLARDGLSRMIKADDRDQYRYGIRDGVQSALDNWPKESNDTRALQPYWACKQAAVDLLQYGDAWARRDESKAWREHVMKNFRADLDDCRGATR